VVSFVEISPLRKEISRHRRTDGQPDALPEHIMPAPPIVGGCMKTTTAKQKLHKLTRTDTHDRDYDELRRNARSKTVKS